MFPQRFSRRKSLCLSYICTCCTLPSSQFSGNKCSAGSALTSIELTQVQQMQGQGNRPRKRRGEPTGSRSPVKAWIPWRTASNWAATQELLGKVILSWCSWENVVCLQIICQSMPDCSEETLTAVLVLIYFIFNIKTTVSIFCFPNHVFPKKRAYFSINYYLKYREKITRRTFPVETTSAFQWFQS